MGSDDMEHDHCSLIQHTDCDSRQQGYNCDADHCLTGREFCLRCLVYKPQYSSKLSAYN